MFKNLSLGRNQILMGILLLVIIITSISMIRISYNEGIIESYEAISRPLPERSKIGMLDAFWQKYTGGTRKNVSLRDAQRAEDAINSSYKFMIGADVVLMIAGIGFVLQPIVSKRLGSGR